MGFILGLQGAAKAGKDTVADYLVSQYNWGQKLSFADNLKEMCKAIFFLTDGDLHTQEGKERKFTQPKVFTQRNLGSVLYWMSQTHAKHSPAKGSKEYLSSIIGTELLTPRHVLQFVGTNVCREIIPTYHLDIVDKTISDNPDVNFIITDIRFPNEGDLVIDNFGGSVIQINRSSPLEENIDRAHRSETAMSDWGRFTDVIDNHKDGLPFLFAEVDNLLKRQNLWQTTTTQSLKNLKEDSSHMVVTEDQNVTGTTQTTNLTSVD